MTRERQDITEDFYSGNYKEIHVTCYNDDGSPKNLTGAEVTYAMFTADGETTVLLKSSVDPNEIGFVDAPNGELVIYIQEPDTLTLNGTYRHQANVVDSTGKEETIFTGKVHLFKSFARRYRKDSVSAYLVGG